MGDLWRDEGDLSRAARSLCIGHMGQAVGGQQCLTCAADKLYARLAIGSCIPVKQWPQTGKSALSGAIPG